MRLRGRYFANFSRFSRSRGGILLFLPKPRLLQAWGSPLLTFSKVPYDHHQSTGNAPKRAPPAKQLSATPTAPHSSSSLARGVSLRRAVSLQFSPIVPQAGRRSISG